MQIFAEIHLNPLMIHCISIAKQVLSSLHSIQIDPFSIEAGIPLSDLQAQLGHVSLATKGVYLKASPNHRREAYMQSSMSSFLTEDIS